MRVELQQQLEEPGAALELEDVCGPSAPRCPGSPRDDERSINVNGEAELVEGRLALRQQVLQERALPGADVEVVQLYGPRL
eukprot:scaffold5731_cov239-Pinguiococcus_pyrenoidosus.AAC.5